MNSAVSGMSVKRFGHGLLVVGLLALVMRILVGSVWQLIPHVAQDSGLYFRLADNLLQHGIYSTSDVPPLIPSSLRMPLYPLFLAAVRMVSGEAHWQSAILAVQYGLGALSCVLLAILGSQIANRWVGLLAGLISAFYVGYYYTATVFLRETLSLFILLSLFVSVLGFLRTGSLRLGCLAAGLFGISVVNRPETVSVGAFLLILFCPEIIRVIKGRRRVIVLLAVLALAPWAGWAARNAAVHHHWLPFSTDGAWGLYMGQVFSPEEAWNVADPAAMKIIRETPVEYDWYLRMNREAIAAAKAHPLRNAAWGMEKIRQTFLSYDKNGLSFLYPMLWAVLPFVALRHHRRKYVALAIGLALAAVHVWLGDWDRRTVSALLQTSFADIVVPGAVGFALLMLKPENTAWKTMAASFMTLIVGIVVVVAHYRMRLVFCDWILMIGTAHLAWRCAEWLREVAHRRWA